MVYLQIITIVLALLLLSFWFWMLNDLIKNDYLTRDGKNRWFLLFIILNVIGAFWYYIEEYRPRHI